MKMTAQGWRRDSGPKTICDFEIGDGRQKNGSSYAANVLYLENSQKGIMLSFGPATLTLGGQYQIKILLTREDIARLFLETHPELRDTFKSILA